MGDAPFWFLGMFRAADAWLRGLSRRLRGMLRLMRAVVALLVVLDLTILAAAVLVVLRPEYVHYVAAFTLAVLLIPMIALTMLATLPLRFRSVTRLIDKGYPANAKELALRALARKFRDQSIETEELLAQALWNEARKALRLRETREEQAAAAAAQAAAEQAAADAAAAAAATAERRMHRAP